MGSKIDENYRGNLNTHKKIDTFWIKFQKLFSSISLALKRVQKEKKRESIIKSFKKIFCKDAKMLSTFFMYHKSDKLAFQTQEKNLQKKKNYRRSFLKSKKN